MERQRDGRRPHQAKNLAPRRWCRRQNQPHSSLRGGQVLGRLHHHDRDQGHEEGPAPRIARQGDRGALKEVLGVPRFLSSATTGLNVEVGFLALAKSSVSDLDAKLSARQAVEEAAHEFIVVADQIVMDFCDVMGGHEAAMPIVRQQLMKAGVDVRAPTREGLRLAVDYLAEAESAFRNAADVEASKKKRIGWIKTVP